MANKSGWKNFEKQIATALGGERVHRTMGSFSTECPDVRWRKKVRKKYPKLKTVVVEVKKRKAINIYRYFNASKLKYCGKGKHLILATKTPATAGGRKAWAAMKGKLGKRYGLTRSERKHLKLHDFIAPLITVELGFFVELWDAWLGRKHESR